MSRVGVVTGCAGGVGAATVTLLRDLGWHVVGIDRRPADEGVECDERIVADLGAADALESLALGIGERYGEIAGLVNNGAEQDTRPIADLTTEHLVRIMAVNLGAAHVLTRALAPALDRAGGAVVNVASVHAIASTPQMAAYASSKGAIVAYTRVSALELAPRVRVNAVLPGAVDTPMLRAGLSRRPEDGTPEQALAALSARTPLGRVATAMEIAGVIEFLLDGTRSGFITGQGLVADGGVTVRLPSE